ncbi:MAG: LptF/LptG family permease [Bacteroidales bacterium]|nr:LptF/LptG family permease [Bacteroidales bacterium]MBQ5958470.1 LptF/LptG family permease [Bacteroidales bacterium]MBR6272068.1 LptF/LptG family permease [Bacteroidales bacterium]
MKKLYQLILKSFLGSFVFTFFIVIFVLLMQFLWVYVDDLVGKGLSFKILMELFFHASLTFVPMALPLAILLASIMSFGDLGEHYELVAMKASGISMWKVMRPLVIFSVLLSGLAFVFSNSINPVATLKFKTLLFDVRKQKLAFDIKEGIFYKDIENYIIYVDKKGKDGSTIYGVKIYDHTDREGNNRIMVADSGVMSLSPNQRTIIFTLYNGHNYTEDNSDKQTFKFNRPFERMSFREEQIKFSLESFDLTRSNGEMYKSYQAMMNTRQLSTAMDSLQRKLDEKESSYGKKLMQRLSNYNNRTDQEPDSVYSLQWPLADHLDAGNRTAVLEMAFGSARNTKENISFQKQEVGSQHLNIKKHKKEFHKKFTLSFACLIFFFIGAPLGTIIRKGGLGLPVVVSVLFFVIYYIISTVAERMAEFGNLNMFLGVWLSSLLIFPVGLFLTFKATSDSSLLDGDSWKKMLRNLFSRKAKHHENTTAL